MGWSGSLASDLEFTVAAQSAPAGLGSQDCRGGKEGCSIAEMQ